MQVTQEPLDPCQVALTIEIEPDKVVQATDRAYREYAKYVSVPGFRKGKAPMNFVRQRVPETDIRQRAVEILVEPAYAEAIEQENVLPYAPPKLELVQFDLADKPFIFKAIVPLAPQVALGPYVGLTVERSKYALSDTQVEAQVERMRERAAEYPKVERPVQQGDLVIADVAAAVEARPEAAESRPTMLEIGSDNIPGFDEQVVGMSVGDEKTFTLTYPSDYPEEDLAGEQGDFTVKVNEIRERQMPELNDEFAKKVSNDRFETLDALKTDIRQELEKSLLDAAERAAEASVIEQIVAGSTISFPPVLVETEVNDDVKQLMQGLQGENATLEDYLQQSGKTREQLMQDFQQAADQRIRFGLALAEVAEKENLALTEADVDAALAERAEKQGTTPAAMRAYIESNNAMEALRNRAQTKKVLDFLMAAAIINDKVVQAGESSDADAPAPEEPAKKKPAKRIAKKTESSNQ